jgi:hypothetical protein
MRFQNPMNTSRRHCQLRRNLADGQTLLSILATIRQPGVYALGDADALLLGD